MPRWNIIVRSKARQREVQGPKVLTLMVCECWPVWSSFRQTSNRRIAHFPRLFSGKSHKGLYKNCIYRLCQVETRNLHTCSCTLWSSHVIRPPACQGFSEVRNSNIHTGSQVGLVKLNGRPTFPPLTSTTAGSASIWGIHYHKIELRIQFTFKSMAFYLLLCLIRMVSTHDLFTVLSSSGIRCALVTFLSWIQWEEYVGKKVPLHILGGNSRSRHNGATARCGGKTCSSLRDLYRMDYPRLANIIMFERSNVETQKQPLCLRLIWVDNEVGKMSGILIDPNKWTFGLPLPTFLKTGSS